MAWIKRSAIFSLLIIIAVIIVGSFIAYTHLNKPVSATYITTPRSSSVTPALNFSPIWVNNKYVIFSYPELLNPMNQVIPSSPELAVFNYSHIDVETWHLAITINSVQQPTLQDDSAYVYREDYPNRYQQNSATYGNNTFAIMTDMQSGDFRKVAFILHGSETADISLYGNDPTSLNGLNNTFSQVLKSWNWQ